MREKNRLWGYMVNLSAFNDTTKSVQKDQTGVRSVSSRLLAE